MAIATIAKPLISRVSKLRLRPKPPSAAPPPPPAAPRRNDDEFRQVFRYLDTNGDGRISADELRAYFAAAGDAVSHDKAARMIGEICGGDCSSPLLGFGEFVKVMEMRGDEEEDDVVLRGAFEVYEVEKGSGFITAEGLSRVLNRLGQMKTVQECRAMIGVYDLDGNGVLDFYEFSMMMR